jgi:hypothetical protein
MVALRRAAPVVSVQPPLGPSLPALADEWPYRDGEDAADNFEEYFEVPMGWTSEQVPEGFGMLDADIGVHGSLKMRLVTGSG